MRGARLVGWVLGGYRLLSIFIFCGVLLASALYWYADRVAVGLVGARELPVGESPGLHSTLERLAAVAGVMKPRLYLIDDGLPRALAAGRGPRGSVLAVSTGLLTAASPPSSRACWHTSSPMFGIATSSSRPRSSSSQRRCWS